MKKNTSDILKIIPGIGTRLAKDLRDLGIMEPSDLKVQDPKSSI